MEKNTEFRIVYSVFIIIIIIWLMIITLLVIEHDAILRPIIEFYN